MFQIRAASGLTLLSFCGTDGYKVNKAFHHPIQESIK
jgi:hypothetical protein